MKPGLLYRDTLLCETKTAVRVKVEGLVEACVHTHVAAFRKLLDVL
jgi:hypothetical protein